MHLFPRPLQKLIGELCRLPSIGEKSAARLAYHLVAVEPALGHSLAAVLAESLTKVQLCERCFFLSEAPLCQICTNPARDPALLCIVEKPMDLLSIERVGDYRGYYHVLHGLWAPLRGQGPEQMRIKELQQRLAAGGIEEVILATGSTVEGDATALYVARLVEDLGIKATRLAQGMPKGGELEYMDEITLSRALAGRSRVG